MQLYHFTLLCLSYSWSIIRLCLILGGVSFNCYYFKLWLLFPNYYSLDLCFPYKAWVIYRLKCLEMISFNTQNVLFSFVVQVTIYFFAKSRDLLGQSKGTISVPQETTSSSLFTIIHSAFPRYVVKYIGTEQPIKWTRIDKLCCIGQLKKIHCHRWFLAVLIFFSFFPITVWAVLRAIQRQMYM